MSKQLDNKSYNLSSMIDSGAIGYLEKRKGDIKAYFDIIDKVNDVDVASDLDFQRVFNRFYRVRRNQPWRSAFYSLMEECKDKKDCSFKYVLRELCNRTAGRVEASFASKLIATLKPDLPIIDSVVLKRLGIKNKTGKTVEERLDDRECQYEKVQCFYRQVLDTQANEYIRRFDATFPEYQSISKTKKLDFLLWVAEMPKN